jgi:hypothetical protein
MEVLFGYFNVMVEREDTFKPTGENESLHRTRYDNGVRGKKFCSIKKCN